MGTFWAVASFIGLGAATYWFARQAMVARGQPTSDTSVGAEDDKGPQLRQYVDNLYAKLRAQGLAWDEWGVDWRTVLVFYKDPAAEAIVKGALLLPEEAVDLDGKFYHFQARHLGGALKTPEWIAEEEE